MSILPNDHHGLPEDTPASPELEDLNVLYHGATVKRIRCQTEEEAAVYGNGWDETAEVIEFTDGRVLVAWNNSAGSAAELIEQIPPGSESAP